MKKWIYIFVFIAACLHAGHIREDVSAVVEHIYANDNFSGEYLDNCQKAVDLLSQTMVFTAPVTESAASHENRINVLRSIKLHGRGEKSLQDTVSFVSSSLLKNTGVKFPRIILAVIGESSFTHIKDYYVFLLRHIII